MRYSSAEPFCRKTETFLSTFLGRFAVGILFPALILACVATGFAEESQSEGIDGIQAVDNDDIEEKVDSVVKVAQKTNGSGVVWGKSKKSGSDEKKDPEKADGKRTKTPTKSEPVETSQKTTVKRPVTPPDLSPVKKEEKVKDTKKYLLKSGRKKGSTDLVETLLEVKGDVKQINDELDTVKEKMEVVAGFRYEERIDRFSLSNGPLVSVRQYNLAKAKMKIADEIKTPQLDESLQTIICMLDGSKVSLFSPNGPLRSEELLLVEDLPGNTLTLDRLLPNKEVAIGDGWIIPEHVLRSFLSIDAVTECNVEAVLTAVADNMAMVEIIGDVSGIYLGASTEMSVQAKFQFDLGTQRINWLGLLIEEDRSIGFVGPGFDLVARLQVKISPIDKPQSLTDEIMKTIDKEPDASSLDLKYDTGKGPWRFRHHRDWYIYQDMPQTTVLHKLYKGDLVARCNIADMGKVDVKTMATLPKFQKELEEGLGKSFSSVVSAEEYEHPHGYQVYTVLIDGVVDDLALRWIYNLLTDEDGRQAVVVFVVESAMLEQFDKADEELLETFRMGKGRKSE